jgi:hypothetical protein
MDVLLFSRLRSIASGNQEADTSDRLAIFVLGEKVTKYTPKGIRFFTIAINSECAMTNHYR